MRILLLSHARNDPDAGASRIYHHLIDGLAERGHETSVLHLDDMGLPSSGPLELAIRRLLLPRAVSRAARRRHAVDEFDVVMSSSGMAAPLFRSLGRSSSRPFLVNHIHGLSAFDHLANVHEAGVGRTGISLAARAVSGPLQRRWDEAGIRYADHTIVQNLRDASEAERRVGHERFSMVPGAVDDRILRAASLRTSMKERGRAAVLWFGTWEARKGALHVVDAYTTFRRRIPDATLTVGGTGRKEAEIRQLFPVADRDSVTVLPRVTVPEQIALLDRHSIFLFPSLSEGFGLALVEAMAMGVVPVTTTTGFGGDVVLGSQAGLIVPTTSAHIGRALIQVVEDDAFRYRASEEAARVAGAYTQSRMTERYESIFLSGCRAKRGDGAGSHGGRGRMVD